MNMNIGVIKGDGIGPEIVFLAGLIPSSAVSDVLQLDAEEVH